MLAAVLIFVYEHDLETQAFLLFNQLVYQYIFYILIQIDVSFSLFKWRHRLYDDSPM
jgi:hypothetical protein